MSLDILNAAVRPLVTLMLVAVLCYGFVTAKVGAEAFLSIVSVVVGFWFSTRQAVKDSMLGSPSTPSVSPPAPPVGGPGK